MNPEGFRKNHPPPGGRSAPPDEYEIRVGGTLDPGWMEWIPGMKMRHRNARSGAAETILRGSVPDQSGLRGILCKLWDLGLTVHRVEKLQGAPDERRRPT